MDRVENITSIFIYLEEQIKLEITRNNEVEVIVFSYEEHEKKKALKEFIDIFKLYDIKNIKIKGVHYDN